jgi:hypothetical protein
MVSGRMFVTARRKEMPEDDGRKQEIAGNMPSLPSAGFWGMRSFSIVIKLSSQHVP